MVKRHTHTHTLTCALRHAPLACLFGPWGLSALRDGLPPVLVAPLPVWVGLEVSLFHLGDSEGGRENGGRERKWSQTRSHNMKRIEGRMERKHNILFSGLESLGVLKGTINNTIN